MTDQNKNAMIELLDQLQQEVGQPVPFEQILRDFDWKDIVPCDEFIL